MVRSASLLGTQALGWEFNTVAHTVLKLGVGHFHVYITWNDQLVLIPDLKDNKLPGSGEMLVKRK